MKLITAPDELNSIEWNKYTPSLFLAGSIEEGKAPKWQDKAIDFLEKENIIILNPRRDNWSDLSDKAMIEQIKWEHDALQIADYRLFNFCPDTISPITLMELGWMLPWGKENIIVCPKDYKRYMNVKVFTDKYHTTIYSSLDEGLRRLLTYLSF